MISYPESLGIGSVYYISSWNDPNITRTRNVFLIILFYSFCTVLRLEFYLLNTPWLLNFQGFHIGTKELEEMGRCFCAGLLKLGNSSSITALLGTIPKLSMDELEADDDIL
jgi:hypothetical protein